MQKVDALQGLIISTQGGEGDTLVHIHDCTAFLHKPCQFSSCEDDARSETLKINSKTHLSPCAAT